MNKLILYLRRALHNCRKCGFSRAHSFFTLCKALIRKVWFVKNTESSGFSMMEMSVALVIVALTSIAGVKVLNSKIEQNTVDRVVADLFIVAEAAYECYTAGECEDDDRWTSTTSVHLDDFLPLNFSTASYSVTPTITITISGRETSELVITATNIKNKRIAQRVANTFGSLAIGPLNSCEEEEEDACKQVEVPLGIPGTESALSGLRSQITGNKDQITGNKDQITGNKDQITGNEDRILKIKNEDFAFEGEQRNIKNVRVITTNRIRIGGSRDAGGVELRKRDAQSLIGLSRLGCIAAPGDRPKRLFKTSRGSFGCTDAPKRSCPYPGGGQALYIGEHRRTAGDSTCRVNGTATVNPPIVCPASNCTSSTVGNLKIIYKPGRQVVAFIRCDIDGGTVRYTTNPACKVACPTCRD